MSIAYCNTDEIRNKRKENKMKTNKHYYTLSNIGKAKYVVKFHDGIKLHKDKSIFYDIAIFKNKKKLNSFVKQLTVDGYFYK